MATPVLIYYDERMLSHNPQGWDPSHPEWTDAVKVMIALQYPDSSLETYIHPERPDRLTAIVDRLFLEPIEGVRWMLPVAASVAQLEQVHDVAYVAYIQSLDGLTGWLAKDTTAVSPGSEVAAGLAAGAGTSAIDAVVAGQARRAFCIVRPPGHHAPGDRAMGFCLYNNMAVTAAHARTALGGARDDLSGEFRQLQRIAEKPGLLSEAERLGFDGLQNARTISVIIMDCRVMADFSA